MKLEEGLQSGVFLGLQVDGPTTGGGGGGFKCQFTVLFSLSTAMASGELTQLLFV